jgi:arsenate reductase
MPDPAAVNGPPEEIQKAFADTARALRRRIEILASLPMEKLDAVSLQKTVRNIAK